MTNDDWKTLAEVSGGLAQVVAAVAAGCYFLIRWRRGALITNLAVTISCERVKCPQSPDDWLAIRLSLKKLDRNSLTLHDARARVTDHSRQTLYALISFWGTNRYAYDSGGIDARYRVDWNHLDFRDPGLNLTPGEEIQLAGGVLVPSDLACQVDVVILGEPLGPRTGCAQWQASAVSLPVTESSSKTSSKSLHS